MFITFEGPEGSGKTSQIPVLRDYLNNAGYPIFCTREPGGTSIGDQIREVLLANRNTEMHPRTEILLFQASRAQLVEQEIIPRMKRGEIVLCDRYGLDTSLFAAAVSLTTGLSLLTLPLWHSWANNAALASWFGI